MRQTSHHATAAMTLASKKSLEAADQEMAAPIPAFRKFQTPHSLQRDPFSLGVTPKHT